MHTGEESNNVPVPLHPDSGPPSAALKAENEQLREQLRQLAEERDRDRQALTALQAERDACLRSLHAWAWERVTAEELDRWAQDEAEEGVTFAELLQKLERPQGQ